MARSVHSTNAAGTAAPRPMTEPDVGFRRAHASALPVTGAWRPGDPVGHRHIWWNFVASSRERIEQAKADWRAQKFDSVPGDDEFIPLPE